MSYRAHGLPTNELFELQLELPDPRIAEKAARLVGFPERLARLETGLRLMIDVEGVEAWSRRFHHVSLPLLRTLPDRYPLVIFHGDVGTGKTETAEAIANALATATGKPGTLFKLSTRVRGEGFVGQMTALISQAFAAVAKEAGKARTAYLIVDEGDSLTSSRATVEIHHEDKVAVNTLIQKLDAFRRLGGRALVFLCTNRYEVLDPAILRRSLAEEWFDRPNAQERRELLEMDLEGIDLDPDVIEQLVEMTGGANGPGYTFSDLRTRLLPAALASAFPDRALTADDLLAAAKRLAPTPSFDAQRAR
ncbi:MAG TPA: AAA family ATPase [Acidimicrobiales bacterium]|nr:AAA family ATPase [Acidimicrobiales bacterium]